VMCLQERVSEAQRLAIMVNVLPFIFLTIFFEIILILMLK